MTAFDPSLVPARGAVVHLLSQPGLPGLLVILDVARGLLHVLRDDGTQRWEGRAPLEPLARAGWSARLAQLEPPRPGKAAAVASLTWRPDVGQDVADVRVQELTTLRTRRRDGPVSFARDICALALGTSIDHPLAAQALNGWNQRLNFAATVQFGDGSPRRVRIVGMVDPPGLRNLQAFSYVLRDAEPIIVDLTACASLGAWDPSELIAGHTVAWVGARGGVEDALHDLGVPREAFHASASTAREWLRG